MNCQGQPETDGGITFKHFCTHLKFKTISEKQDSFNGSGHVNKAIANSLLLQRNYIQVC